MSQRLPSQNLLKNWEDFCYDFFIDEVENDLEKRKDHMLFSRKILIVLFFSLRYLLSRLFFKMEETKVIIMKNRSNRTLPETRKILQNELEQEESFSYLVYEPEKEINLSEFPNKMQVIPLTPIAYWKKEMHKILHLIKSFG